jgi:hypothetical protein
VAAADVENKSVPKVTETTNGYVEMEASIPTIAPSEVDVTLAGTSTNTLTSTATSLLPPATATSSTSIPIEAPSSKSTTATKRDKPKSVVFSLVRPFLRIGKWRRAAKKKSKVTRSTSPTADYVSMV